MKPTRNHGSRRGQIHFELLETRQLLAAAPQTVSVSPDEPSVSPTVPIVLTGRFYDADGRQDIRLTELRISNTYSTTPRCFVRYDALKNLLMLYDNASAKLITVGAPGSNNTATIAECTLHASGSSVTAVSPTTLDVSVNLSFSAAMEGTRKIWLRSFDKTKKWSSIDERGHLTVGTVTQTPTSSGPTAPTTVSADPNSGTVGAGNAVVLTGRFADVNGAADIDLVELRVSDAYSTTPRCFVRYYHSTNVLTLYDNRTKKLISAGKPGSGNPVSIAECSLDPAASSVSLVDANTLDVSVGLTFTSAIAGSRDIWLRAYDFSNKWSTIDDRGDITIVTGTVPVEAPVPSSPQVPKTVGVTPNDLQIETGSPLFLTGRYSDANGHADIRIMEIRVADDFSTQPRCIVRYDKQGGEFKLYDDAVGTFVTNGGGPISNANCTLTPGLSSLLAVDDETLELQAHLSLKAPLAGSRNIWLRALDYDGNWSSKDDRGDIQIKIAAPSGGAVSVVDGYTDKQSYDQHTTQQVYINAAKAVDNATIHLYDESSNIVDSIRFHARPQSPRNVNPAQNGFGYNPSFTYDIGSLPSGVYLWANSIPFVVKDTSKTSSIRVVMPTNTMNAYSCAGGQNLYANCGGAIADFVHFDRMMTSVPQTIPGTGITIRRETGGLSIPFFWWLEQEIDNLGVSYGVLADSDLDDPRALDGAELVVIPGHSEYWTRAARENVDAFVDAGGDLAVLSGNSVWWQSRYENDRLVVWKSRTQDPTPNPLLETINWNHPSLNYPIIDSIGADFQYGGYLNMNPPGNAPASFNGYKIVTQNSPLLEGLGVQEGEIITWDSKQIFTEYDGPPVSGSDARGYPIIDRDVLGFHQVELIAFDHAFRGDEGYGALMAFQKSPTSGFVVNVGTMMWAYEMTMSPDAAKLQRITFNILDKLLADEEIFSSASNLKFAAAAVAAANTATELLPTRDKTSAVDEVFRRGTEYSDMLPTPHPKRHMGSMASRPGSA